MFNERVIYYFLIYEGFITYKQRLFEIFIKHAILIRHYYNTSRTHK